MSMKYIGLDNKTYKIDTKSNLYEMRTEAACKSKFQYRCGQIIKNKFPQMPILEEFKVPDANLTFDFFIPTLRIAFEIDGKQHSEYNSFFYKNRKDFSNAKDRDSNKEIICDKNNWTLYRIETEEQLTDILNG